MKTNLTPDLNLVAEITLQYRPKISPTMRPSTSSAKEAYEILMSTWNPDTLQLKEEFKVMLLNRANKVLGIVTTSSGGMNAAIVDPKINLWCCSERRSIFDYHSTQSSEWKSEAEFSG